MPHKKMTFVISGASGFIGSNLADYLASKNHMVHALVRTLPKEPKRNITYHKFDLTSPTIDSDLLERANVFVHAAFIESKNNSALMQNIKAAKSLLKQCHQHNIKFVFISSLSAQRDALSDYGKQKFAIEQLLGANDVALRLGLVIGNGGLAKKMIDHISKFRIVPIIDHGKQPLQIVSIDDLLIVIEKACRPDITGVLHIANSDMHTLRDFYKTVGAKTGRRPIFVPVPFRLLYAVLLAAERLKLGLGASKDNLLGLKKLKYVDTKDDLKKVEADLLGLEDSIDRINP